MKKLILLTSLLSFLFITCKKSDLKPIDDKNSRTDEIEWTIMSNPTDPMFAVAKIGESEIEYYGERDARGFPSKLRSFIVKNSKETISYSLDVKGKIASIQHSNGVRFRYVWKGDDEVGLTLTSPDGRTFLRSIALDKSGKEGTSIPSKPAGNGDQKSIEQQTTDNITVNVTSCGKPVNYNIGDVSIQLRNTVGDQQITSIPATFSNGKYTASLPREVETNLVASQELCNQIANILSKEVCKAVNAPGVPQAANLACLFISGLIATGGITAPLAPYFLAVCEGGSNALILYCKITEGKFLDKICNATYKKRVFGQYIYLQPTIYYNGSLIFGDQLATRGGPEPIELSLDLGCNPTLSLVSGNNQTGEINTTLSNPLVVKVVDAINNPIPGITVEWQASSRSGVVIRAGLTTDLAGEATASWTLGSTIGEQTIAVTATNADGSALVGSPLIFGATATAANSLATLTTSSPTTITSISAVSGGNIFNDGGTAITARGVCWSTAQNPTIANNKTSDGSGSGSFISNISGLTANTTYYVRAYATNSLGTAYGNPVSFTTNQTAPSINITGLYPGYYIASIDPLQTHEPMTIELYGFNSSTKTILAALWPGSSYLYFGVAKATVADDGSSITFIEQNLISVGCGFSYADVVGQTWIISGRKMTGDAFRRVNCNPDNPYNSPIKVYLGN